MRAIFLSALLLASASVSAQIYRWTDAQGTTHFSNTQPPPGVQATVIDPSSREALPGPESSECYTLRCQGERLDERMARREELETRMVQERAAAAPPVRGLEFRKYISIQRGMSEGELVGVAGKPDMLFRERNVRRYTYMPTPADPFTTTVTLQNGRVWEVERARKF